jgi:hypothetical protein
VQIEKLTTSLQLIGAALAVPAGIAGVYSAYHSYFSPEVRCQEMRNSTLVTLEKNIPAEAKRALLHTDIGQFQAKCGDVEPETAMVFQVALQELEKPAAAPPPKPGRPAPWHSPRRRRHPSRHQPVPLRRQRLRGQSLRHQRRYRPRRHRPRPQHRRPTLRRLQCNLRRFRCSLRHLRCSPLPSPLWRPGRRSPRSDR